MENKKKVQVVIMAMNPPSLLLLLTNSNRGSFWQNVTGSLEEGESFEQAAKRELQEETGIELSSSAQLIDLDLTFNFKDRKKNQIEEKVFFYKIETTLPITLDEREHQKFRWFPLSEITKENYKYSTNFEAFQKALNYV